MADKVGELYYDLTINKSKFDTELNSLENVAGKASTNIKNSFNQAFSTLSPNAKNTMQSVKNSVNSVSDSVGNSASAIKNAFNASSSSAENSFNVSAQSIKGSVQNIENSAKQSSQDIKNSFSTTSSSSESQFKQATQKMKTSVEGLEDTVEKSNEEIKNSSKNSTKSMSDNFKTSAKKMKSESNNAAVSIGNSFKKSAVNIKATFDMVIGSIRTVISGCKDLMSAYQTQIEAETRLEATMRNSTGATDEQIQSVKDLASELQSLGVVGDEVQLAGMQELATYIENADSLKTMLPVLDDMIAQQYGFNASTDSAVTISTMLGKVLNGQTSALSRYGYSFTEAQEQMLKYGTEEQKVATLAEVVEQSVRGVNSALANTPTGKVKQLSNDFGDLKESLGNLITNVFYPIVKWLDVIVIKLNSAFSTLNGYIKELFGIEQESVSGTGISDISDSAYDATDAVDSTTDSVNALKKSVAGFDQLNILSDNSDKSSNDTAGSGATSSGISTITAPSVNTSGTEKSINKMLKNIKKNFQSFYKSSGIENFIKKIQNALSSIDFKSIANNFKSIMQNLKPIAKSYLNGVKKIFKSYMNVVGSIISGVISLTGKSIQTVSGGIAKWLNKDKDKIAGYIDTISTNISSGLNNISIFVDTVATTVGASIDRMRPTMENAIASLLDGATTLSGNFGTIIAEAFNGATGVISQWAIDNESIIGTFFDNIQLIFSDSMTFIGNIFEEVGNAMVDWWQNSGGKDLWEKFISLVSDLGEIFMKVFNEWIKPAWDTFVGILQSAWDNYIFPVFKSATDCVTKIGNALLDLWNNILKPIVDWLIDFFTPIFKNSFKQIQSVCDTVFSAIGGFLSGFWDSLSGLIDFITGVFTGDWTKAWNGVKSIFEGVWNAIWSVIKGIINLMIDGINGIWTGIYNFAKGVVDTIGGISGAIGRVFGQDWSFNLPDDVPTIPKLAKGGLVSAPTLALVGDNKNARSDPEVVSPLSKLKTMINDEQGSGGNAEILVMLRKIYDLISSQETQYTNVIYLDSEEIERKLVKVRKRKSRRYGGALS